MVIRQKFDNAAYPSLFTNSVIRDYEHKQNKRARKNKNKKMSALYHLIFLKLRKNQFWWGFQIVHKMSLQLNDSCQSSINSPTKSFKWLFSGSLRKFKGFFLKDNNPYPACEICEGTCVCDETYVGETIRNVDIRWNEHQDIREESEPAKHLRENLNHTLK